MEPQKIVIDPVTRIEGHSKISIHLDEQGRVEEAHFHVTQFRGFEKFCEGRPFYEMPSLMARICGICPVSHLIASAKACDAILAVEIPPNARRLRRILNLAQIVQSHALSFFYLASPDLLLGMDGDPATRNFFGVMEAHPAMARDGVRLRQFGQQAIEWMAGKRIHPAWVVPGGVAQSLAAEARDRILAAIPEALAIARRTLDWFKNEMERFREEIRTFANSPTLFMGLVGAGGTLEHYDGKLRFLDAGGHVVADGVDGAAYAGYIAEIAHPWTYLKTSYYKPLGYPDGIYRVGPLARLNIIDGCDTPGAAQEWAEFRELDRGAVLSSFYFHYARLFEEAGLPPGVLNLVLGTGGEVGRALVAHEALDAVTFTGSVPVGRAIAAQTTGRGVRSQLELGGHNAAVVFADADLRRAAAHVVAGAMLGSGQKCTSTRRVIVHCDVYDDFVPLVLEEVGRLRVGDGFGEGVDVGPLVSEQARDEVAAEVERAESKLNNPAFVAKAPPQVLEEQRKRLADWLAKRDQVRTRLAAIP